MIICNSEYKSNQCVQQCIQKMSIAIVHTLNVMHTKMVNSNNANKICRLQQCIQKLSFAIFSIQNYRSFEFYQFGCF